jgi:hypothetical protein
MGWHPRLSQVAPAGRGQACCCSLGITELNCYDRLSSCGVRNCLIDLHCCLQLNLVYVFAAQLWCLQIGQCLQLGLVLCRTRRRFASNQPLHAVCICTQQCCTHLHLPECFGS